MSTASVVSEHKGPYTVSDLLAMSEDGQRYQLIDGGLYVTPAAGGMHQRATRRLGEFLNAAGRQHELETLDSVAVDCGGDTVLEPDGVMLPAKVIETWPRVIPAHIVVLVAEVISPSSMRMDRMFKARMYADAGIPHYLLIEPEVPRITWLVLAASGGYEQRQVAEGDDALTLSEPLSVELVPSQLLRAWG
jgi:Uma2 family endonuclease